MYEWQRRALNTNTTTTKDNETVRTASSHYKGKEILYPTIRMIDGKLKKLSNKSVDGRASEAMQHALIKGDYLEFVSPNQATAWSKSFSNLIDSNRKKNMTQKEAAKILRRNAPAGEFPAFINPQEASWLKGMGASGRKTKSGLRSYFMGEFGGGGSDTGSSRGRDSSSSNNSSNNNNSQSSGREVGGDITGTGAFVAHDKTDDPNTHGTWNDIKRGFRDATQVKNPKTGKWEWKAAPKGSEQTGGDGGGSGGSGGSGGGYAPAGFNTRTPQGPGSVSNPNDPYGIQKKIAEGAKGLIDKEYEAPEMTPEQRIAGVSDQTTQARKMTQDMVGTGQQAFGDAAGVGQQVSQYNPNQVQSGNFLQGQQVSDYMSPHTDNVIKGMQDNAMRTMQKQRGALQAQHQMAGAGVGSRGALENAAMAAEVQRGLGQQVAGALEGSYAQAAGMKQADMDRSMQAQRYNQQAGLAGQDVNLRGAQQQMAGTQAGRQAAAQDLGMVSQIGADVEGREQNILDEKWGDAQEKRNWGRDNLALASQISGTMPVGSTTTTTGAQQHQRKNRLGSALAGAASGWLASGGNPWGAAAGGASGFLA